jgi:hypothetical protein
MFWTEYNSDLLQPVGARRPREYLFLGNASVALFVRLPIQLGSFVPCLKGHRARKPRISETWRRVPDGWRRQLRKSRTGCAYSNSPKNWKPRPTIWSVKSRRPARLPSGHLRANSQPKPHRQLIRHRLGNHDSRSVETRRNSAHPWRRDIPAKLARDFPSPEMRWCTDIEQARGGKFMARRTGVDQT